MFFIKKHVYLIGLLSVVISAGYWYYTDTQSRMKTLIENSVKLEQSISELERANKNNLAEYNKLRNDYDVIVQRYENTKSEFAQLRRNNQLLTSKLAKRDLAYLALSKPKLVQKIVNAASTKSMRCFELLSGSPLTAEEREAKNEKQFNSECPWLFSDYSR